MAKAADASLNIVFLTLCGGALRRYLIKQDAMPTADLTANVPVSVRQEGHGASVGDAITFLYARLRVDLASRSSGSRPSRHR